MFATQAAEIPGSTCLTEGRRAVVDRPEIRPDQAAGVIVFAALDDDSPVGQDCRGKNRGA